MRLCLLETILQTLLAEVGPQPFQIESPAGAQRSEYPLVVEAVAALALLVAGRSPRLDSLDIPAQRSGIDAPHPTGWYHWLVVNIPATVSQIASGGQISGALETITDFQQNRYGGACPPVGHGIHHYNFTVYALDVQKLDVTAQTPPVEVEKLVKSHSLAQATITGLYERR